MKFGELIAITHNKDKVQVVAEEGKLLECDSALVLYELGLYRESAVIGQKIVDSVLHVTIAS